MAMTPNLNGHLAAQIAAVRIKHRAVVAAGKNCVSLARDAGEELYRLRLEAEVGNCTMREVYDGAGVPPRRGTDYLRIYKAFERNLEGIRGCASVEEAVDLIKRDEEVRRKGSSAWDGGDDFDGKSLRNFQRAIGKGVKEVDRMMEFHTASGSEELQRVRECLETARVTFRDWLQRVMAASGLSG
jgi:hypothetical protein